MQTLLTLKLDSRMKNALKKLADKQFISVSAAVKQAIERHLKENEIDWRKEDKNPPEKS
jgi:predicted transcriptional regulator